MGRIRWSRVLAGGLVAGILMSISEFLLNGSMLAAEWRVAMLSLGRPDATGSTRAIGLFIGSTLVLGVAAVWFYAAVRPRFGPGPRTALLAGLALWVVAYLVPSMGYLALDLWPQRLTMIGLAVGLPEVLVATLVGAWIYKES